MRAVGGDGGHNGTTATASRARGVVVAVIVTANSLGGDGGAHDSTVRREGGVDGVDSDLSAAAAGVGTGRRSTAAGTASASGNDNAGVAAKLHGLVDKLLSIVLGAGLSSAIAEAVHEVGLGAETLVVILGAAKLLSLVGAHHPVRAIFKALAEGVLGSDGGHEGAEGEDGGLHLDDWFVDNDWCCW